MTQVHRIQKPEWLSAFIEAHNIAFTTQNIKSAFAGAGLVPFNPEKALRRVTRPRSPSHDTPSPDTPIMTTPPLSTPTTPNPFPKEILTISPLDGNKMHRANGTVVEMMAASAPLNTPARSYLSFMAMRNNRLQARNTILEERIEVATAVLKGRKERMSGKRRSIKREEYNHWC